ncbi:MAG: hypothetical protein UY62_C0028G0003 [Parcubacteria group bacterium GW2011_GWF2_50_9]|nr:MAG: hypothetical protein UY62_C0028G0003 [Parcubacteria group bacterium GW2011_GWF2_50_9]
MGHTKIYADKMNLAAMTPRGNLSSTGFALANPGEEYLVYQKANSGFTVNLPAAQIKDLRSHIGKMVTKNLQTYFRNIKRCMEQENRERAATRSRNLHAFRRPSRHRLRHRPACTLRRRHASDKLRHRLFRES